MTASRLPPKWYADGLRFRCTQCGDCCSGAPGYVWVETAEIKVIAEFLKLTPAEFTHRHVRRAGRGRSLKELPDGDCEFLERLDEHTTRCRIHPVRPIQCGTWPFWKSNVRSPVAWEQTARACPGINHGRLYSPAEIEASLRDNGSRPL